MNKNWQKKLLLLLPLLLLLLPSCDRHESWAEVEIANIGDISIVAALDGEEFLIPAGGSHIWEVIWDGRSGIRVELSAYPVGYEDQDIQTISLLDGDYFLWETGWVLEGQRAVRQTARPPRKKS